MQIKTIKMLGRIQEAGFTLEEALQLRRIEMTLQRWAEAECGDSNAHCSRSIERDEATGKPFMVVSYHNENKPRRYAIADRERGALKRLSKVMAAHPSYIAYHQGDCRGCMLYLVPVSALGEGEKIDSVYTRGIAVCD